MHQFLKEEDPELLFDKLPRALNEAAYKMFLVDGIPKAEKQKMAMNIIERSGRRYDESVQTRLQGMEGDERMSQSYITDKLFTIRYKCDDKSHS